MFGAKECFDFVSYGDKTGSKFVHWDKTGWTFVVVDDVFCIWKKECAARCELVQKSFAM